MNVARNVSTLVSVTALAAAGMVAASTAAIAAPTCVMDGIELSIGADGTPTYSTNPACGELYQYDGSQQYPDVVLELPPGADTIEIGADGCLTGIVGDIACDRSQDQWTVPHPVWETSPGGLPECVGDEHPDGTVTVGEPEPVTEDEGTVEVGEPETVGGGGGDGGFIGSTGGGFSGGGGGGSSSGTVTVGDIIAETEAE